jgi:RimJ/RimL family protein N-acetyltransferase
MESLMIDRRRIMVCEKSLEDAAKDYAWQTDAELAQLTATRKLTASFDDYLSKYRRQLRYQQPGGSSFSIKTRSGKHIGNCSCYNLNKAKDEVEIGIIIGDRQYWDKGYGSDAVKWLVDYLFNNNQAIRIHLKTLVSNSRAQRCFAKCGFKICGQLVSGGRNYILMELYYRHWRQDSRIEEEE